MLWRSKFAIFQNTSKSAFLLTSGTVKTMTGTTTGCSNTSLWWNLLTRQTELDRSQHLNISCKNTLTKEPVEEVYFFVLFLLRFLLFFFQLSGVLSRFHVFFGGSTSLFSSSLITPPPSSWTLVLSDSLPSAPSDSSSSSALGLYTSSLSELSKICSKTERQIPPQT